MQLEEDDFSHYLSFNAGFFRSVIREIICLNHLILLLEILTISHSWPCKIKKHIMLSPNTARIAVNDTNWCPMYNTRFYYILNLLIKIKVFFLFRRNCNKEFSVERFKIPIEMYFSQYFTFCVFCKQKNSFSTQLF